MINYYSINIIKKNDIKKSGVNYFHPDLKKLLTIKCLYLSPKKVSRLPISSKLYHTIPKISNIIKESLKNITFDNQFTENSLSIPLKEAREKFEKEYLTIQLKKFNGNISKTANFVGMDRTALHRKLKIFGVKEIN